MKDDVWNHNNHYHALVVGSIPPGCGRALDVGCGGGLLARRLARRCSEVVALDVDGDTLKRASAAASPEEHIRFVEADFMTEQFADGNFDLITAVATLHHLPLKPALKKFRELLRPRGVVAIIGLYRMQEAADYAWAVAAVPSSWILRRFRTYGDVEAPLQEPKQTLREIRAAAEAILPGCRIRRRLLFRYSLFWQKL